jgi:membrane-bound lytic murein transglycosylase B
MTLNFLRRVKGTVVSRIVSLESKIKTNLNKQNIKNIVSRISTFSLAVKVGMFSMVMTSMPLANIQGMNLRAIMAAKADSDVTTTEIADTSVKLDTTVSTLISSSKPVKQEIILGESNAQKTEREANEQKQRELASRQVVVRDSSSTRNIEIVADPDISVKRALAKKAAAKYGIDWKIVEAVWQVESGKAWITPVRSYAGAQGPMQFMKGTWNKYAIDGNGDGVADINNAEDAVYAGANLLAQAGAAEGDYTSALLSYNHAMWYVEKVKAVAASIND